jgi:LmbE family N-acetylglucosaminyl deacetylase
MPATDNSTGPATAPCALVFVAHPDDADFLAAGTLAKWAREGWEIRLVIATDGSKGSDDPEMLPERLIPLRQAEQRAASAVVGLAEVIFLGHEDGMLEDGPRLRREFTRLIRLYRPERVVTMDPTVRWHGSGYINHPDHIAAGSATLSAVSLYARNRPSFRDLLAEGLEPHVVRELYLGSSIDANVWVDIGATLDQKIAALCEHKSQIGQDGLADMIREWARGAAKAAKNPAIEFAEDFRRFELG